MIASRADNDLSVRQFSPASNFPSSAAAEQGNARGRSPPDVAIHPLARRLWSCVCAPRNISTTN
jgi:hypothetical protein